VDDVTLNTTDPNEAQILLNMAYEYSCNEHYKREMKDTKGTVKLINLKQTDNAMAKNEKDKQKNNSTHDTT
jgi:hypothetical protein